MTMKPIEAVILRAVATPTQIRSLTATPDFDGGTLGRLDWRRIVREARARFPSAALRSIALPTKPGGFITVRMRQPGESTPNGRTFLWFDPADGHLLTARDVAAMGQAARISAAFYPVHSGKTGGFIWRLAVTLSGVALTMLGCFAIVTFWSNCRLSQNK